MNQRQFFYLLLLGFLPFLYGLNKNSNRHVNLPNTALVNGKWFNGKVFDELTVYSVNGKFTFKKPATIDTTIDLAGLWMIPPFAEAHNHNIGTGLIESDKKAIQNYLTGGVFYVKIMGNLPITDSTKNLLRLNEYNSVDVVFAQGNITASGGHPIRLVEGLLLRGYYPGYTKETLKDFRYFTIDSASELDRKWPTILKLKPDFIKIIICQSDKFEKIKDDTTIWYKGINPNLIPSIVNKAHREKLKVSAHIVNAADFHNALMAGVDEIAHMPRLISGIPYQPISPGDAKEAARRRVTVITTDAISLFQGGSIKPSDFPEAKKIQSADLKLLYENGVSIAIGSDDPTDNSVKEVFYLKDLGVFDNLNLIKIWTENTPKAIFPNRKIGALREGYEANFIALEGNPVDDLNNVRKIKFRFKNGRLLN